MSRRVRQWMVEEATWYASHLRAEGETAQAIEASITAEYGEEVAEILKKNGAL